MYDLTFTENGFVSAKSGLSPNELAQTGILVTVGTSGAGKFSIVYSGILAFILYAITKEMAGLLMFGPL